ncbi:MAG: porin family protein [Rhizobiales bacterium]|nr:porin family protein [Hyphomicrobiales bacterium]
MKNILKIASALAVFAATPVVAQETDKWDWSGFYGGVHLGVGSHITDWDIDGVEGGFAFVLNETTTSEFLLAGFQLGYNHQIGVYVFGIEGDVSFFDSGSETEFFRNPSNGALTSHPVELDAPDILATLRLRAGWLYNDKTLLFGTAGIAYSHEYKVTAELGPSSGQNMVSAKFAGGLGAVIGGGGEIVVSDHLTLSGSLLYHILSKGSGSARINNGIYMDASAWSQFVTAKVGLNYHF